MSITASDHPVTFDVAYPDKLNRLLWLIKPIMLIPHILFLLVLGIVFYIRVIIAWFTVVFTGKYPRSLFDGNVQFLRYAMNINAYAMMSDLYPAFGTTPKPESPVTFDIAYPPDGKISRLNTLIPLIRVIILIVPIIVMYLRTIVAAILMYIAYLAILFTGNIPKGMFDFILETQRLTAKIQANLLFMTDAKP